MQVQPIRRVEIDLTEDGPGVGFLRLTRVAVLNIAADAREIERVDRDVFVEIIEADLIIQRTVKLRRKPDLLSDLVMFGQAVRAFCVEWNDAGR